MGYVFLCFQSSSTWLGSHSLLFHQPYSWEPESFFSRGAQPPGSSLLCSYHLPSATCSGENGRDPDLVWASGHRRCCAQDVSFTRTLCIKISGTTPASSNKGETYFLLAVVSGTSLRVFSGKWVIGRAEFRHSWFFFFSSLNHVTEVWLTYKQLSIFNTYKLICWEINIHLWTHHHCLNVSPPSFLLPPLDFFFGSKSL